MSLLNSSIQAKDWTAADLPMVHLKDARRYVCDPENILTKAMRDSADFYISQLRRESGIESVYVVVSHVADGDVFRIAQDIGNKYGVGDKKTNRGLVVVIAIDDRSYFIAPGEGLEGDLTDLECDLIGRECIVKNMRLGNADMAVLSTAKAIYSKFKTGKVNLQDTQEDESSDIWALFVLMIVILWLYWAFKGRGNGGSNHGNANHGRGFGPIIWGNPGHLNDSNFGGGFSGGSFGGGSFGGGGAGGGW